MKKIIMDEQKYLDKVKENGNFGKDIGYAVLISARIYRAEGCDNGEIKNRLLNDIQEYEPLLNTVRCKNYISYALKNVDKRKLVKIDEILITKSEMESVMNITSDENAFRVKSLRRLAFALLCFAKFEMLLKGRYEPWINYDLKYIYKSAKLLGRSQSQNNLYLHKLYEMGLVQFAFRKHGVGVKVDFVDRSEEPEIALRVKDISCTGDYFLRYLGRKYIECAVCGKPVPKTTGNLLYCKDCAVIVDKEKARNRMRKLKESKSSE